MVKKPEQVARGLAKCVNYVGAATIEYLYSMDTGEYYFLELNLRLQLKKKGKNKIKKGKQFVKFMKFLWIHSKRNFCNYFFYLN